MALVLAAVAAAKFSLRPLSEGLEAAFAAGAGSSSPATGDKRARRRGAPRSALSSAGAPVAEQPPSWSGGDHGGLNDGHGRSEWTEADQARLRLRNLHNLAAITTEADLNELLSSDAEAGRVTVVDYYAPWCRACQKLRKGVQKMAQDEEFGDVTFACVDFEQARELCNKMQVKKLPTLEIYRGRELKQRWSGANKKRLVERLTSEIEQAPVTVHA